MVKYYKVYGDKNATEPTTIWKIYDNPRRHSQVYRPQDGGWVRCSPSFYRRIIMHELDDAILISRIEAFILMYKLKKVKHKN